MEGNNTPKWDQYGFVLAPDNSGTLITDLKAYLDEAKTRNILVIFVLWNGAVLNNQNAVNLVWDDSKLQTYIDKALKVHFTLSNQRHRLKNNDLLFFKKIGLFRPFSAHIRVVFSTCHKSIDGVPGIRTQGDKMEGADESTELRQHQGPSLYSSSL